MDFGTDYEMTPDQKELQEVYARLMQLHCRIKQTRKRLQVSNLLLLTALNILLWFPQ